MFKVPCKFSQAQLRRWAGPLIEYQNRLENSSSDFILFMADNAKMTGYNSS
jgi:hypothetical protein